MKKILLFIVLLLAFNQHSEAYENVSNQCEIQFIYINGSNNNDAKMKNWFFKGMHKMHPEMLKAINSSEFMHENFLGNGKYKISNIPEAFFWGDKSQEEIQTINSDLSITKMVSPKLAQTVRTLIAHYLHDAIWVSRYRNMHPILQDLHKQVMDNYKKNKQVVLFGYSAGAFVTYEYLFNKLPDIDAYDYFSRTNVSDEFKEFVKINKMKPTCIDALIASNLTVYSAEDRLIPNLNTEQSKADYMKLDEFTCRECIPKGTLKGIINFASPLVLFYSDISNTNYPLTYYNKLLYKYLLENDMFWLTVNYADDPLGYPTTKNISYKDLKEKIDMQINPDNGFLYSKSDVKSRATFIGAHTSYWATSKKFSKSVVKAYEDGFCLYNSENCKKEDNN